RALSCLPAEETLTAAALPSMAPRGPQWLTYRSVPCSWFPAGSCHAAPSRNDAGKQVQDQDDRDQCERRAPGTVDHHLAWIGDVGEDLQRQRVHLLVEVRRGDERRARREQ